MKKPKYESDVYAFIFFCLGVLFIILGCLSFIDIVKPSTYSFVQNQTLLGLSFCFLGIIFCFIQAAFRISSNKKAKLHNELISTGAKIVGTVEKVSMLRRVKVTRKSPFVIYYTYSYKDQTYHSKSCLLWDKPNLSNGDKIDVFVNDNGQSTLVL